LTLPGVVIRGTKKISTYIALVKRLTHLRSAGRRWIPSRSIERKGSCNRSRGTKLAGSGRATTTTPKAAHSCPLRTLLTMSLTTMGSILFLASQQGPLLIKANQRVKVSSAPSMRTLRSYRESSTKTSITRNTALSIAKPWAVSPLWAPWRAITYLLRGRIKVRIRHLSRSCTTSTSFERIQRLSTR